MIRNIMVECPNCHKINKVPTDSDNIETTVVYCSNDFCNLSFAVRIEMVPQIDTAVIEWRRI